MKFSREQLQTNLLRSLRALGRFKILIGLVMVIGIYGFLVWRIESLNTVQPSSNDVVTKNNPLRSAHIDKQVVKQLESLRDNSVNVQSLFNQARNNPFQ